LGAAAVDPTGCEVKKSFVDLLKANQTIILIGAGVGVLGLGLFFALRRPQTQLPSPTSAPMPTMAGGAASAASSGVDEGKTIRIARPDESQGTLQILPGRLEICSGPDAGNVADIRFVRDRTAGNPIPEVTFGRHGQASGLPLSRLTRAKCPCSLIPKAWCSLIVDAGSETKTTGVSRVSTIPARP
jgi:hypothetical protein